MLDKMQLYLKRQIPTVVCHLDVVVGLMLR